MRNRRICIDLGFGSLIIALVDENGQIVIKEAPSIVNEIDDPLGVTQHAYNYNGRYYTVGARTKSGRDINDRGEDLAYLINYGPLMVAHMLREAGISAERLSEYTLVTGVPLKTGLKAMLGQPKQRAIVESLERALSKFTINHESYEFARVLAAPQCLAAYDHCIHSYPTAVAGKDGVILDLGHNTLLMAGVDGCEISDPIVEEYNLGMSYITTYVQSKIGKSAKPGQILLKWREFLNSNGETIYGKWDNQTYDMSRLFMEGMSAHQKELGSFFEAQKELLGQSMVIILSGGGAPYLKAFLESKGVQDIFVPKAPANANVLGYLVMQ